MSGNDEKTIDRKGKNQRSTDSSMSSDDILKTHFSFYFFITYQLNYISGTT